MPISNRWLGLVPGLAWPHAGSGVPAPASAKRAPARLHGGAAVPGPAIGKNPGITLIPAAVALRHGRPGTGAPGRIRMARVIVTSWMEPQHRLAWGASADGERRQETILGAGC